MPAVTENTYGKGKVWYVGTEPTEDFMTDLAEYFVKNSDVESLGSAPEGVEIMTRENASQKWIFVINMTNENKVYSLNDSYKMLEGEREGDLKPYEVHLFVKKKYGR